MDQGAIIGIAVGVGAAALVGILIGVSFAIQNKIKKKEHEDEKRELDSEAGSIASSDHSRSVSISGFQPKNTISTQTPPLVFFDAASPVISTSPAVLTPIVHSHPRTPNPVMNPEQIITRAEVRQDTRGEETMAPSLVTERDRERRYSDNWQTTDDAESVIRNIGAQTWNSRMQHQLLALNLPRPTGRPPSFLPRLQKF